MRIQHNIPAMNALTHYTNNNNALAGNLEKLSSGYKINSAADDAAGLAISEKMRSQIAGLEKAYDNTNDGISLVQTAEGALTEVNSMLTRLKTLATQSANGTYQEEVDREAIQQETNDILDEIDRISQSTNFNGIKLLDGSLGAGSQVKNVTMNSTDAVAGKYTIKTAFADSTDLKKLTVDDIGKSIDYTVTWEDGSGKQQTTTAKLTFKGLGDGTVNSASPSLMYFEDDYGNKVSLSTNGTILKADIGTAIYNALKSDETFNNNFSITVNSDKLEFTARTAGTSGAKVISGGATSLLSVDAFTVGTGANIAGDGMALETTKALDSMQYFDVTELGVVQSSDDAETIQSKVFEIDGHKFALIDNDLTAEAHKNIAKTIGDDITLIEIKSVGTAATAADAPEIAAEISRVTGLTTRGNDTGATVDGLDDGCVGFTEDKLRLGGGGGLTLQVGDTNENYQKVTVAIEDMSSKGIGIAGLDLSTQDAAGDAIDTIKAAVNIVSAQRGKLGALQNRLDHTLNNLDTMTENITSAEAQIRDTNMAKEMTAYTKNNILAQAAQSMLAQANSMPQGVLQLLQ